MSNFDHIGSGVKKINELVLQDGRFLILDKNLQLSNYALVPVGTLSIDTQTGSMCRMGRNQQNQPDWIDIPYLGCERYDRDTDLTAGINFIMNGETVMRLVESEYKY